MCFLLVGRRNIIWIDLYCVSAVYVIMLVCVLTKSDVVVRHLLKYCFKNINSDLNCDSLVPLGLKIHHWSKRCDWMKQRFFWNCITHHTTNMRKTKVVLVKQWLWMCVSFVFFVCWTKCKFKYGFMCNYVWNCFTHARWVSCSIYHFHCKLISHKHFIR